MSCEVSRRPQTLLTRRVGVRLFEEVYRIPTALQFLHLARLQQLKRPRKRNPMFKDQPTLNKRCTQRTSLAAFAAFLRSATFCFAASTHQQRSSSDDRTLIMNNPLSKLTKPQVLGRNLFVHHGAVLRSTPYLG